ncbi:MAG: DUF6265 family protein [Candidatus Acidiferrales bacterium]
MKHARATLCLFSMVLVAFLIEYKTNRVHAAGRSQEATTAKTAKPTVADFAWVTGRWTGLAGKNPTEQVCSAPSNGLLLCVFHEVNVKPPSIEMATLRETPDGFEERVRNFSPELESWEGSAPITLKLESYTPTESIFINADPQSPVKRVILSHKSPDEMSTRVEVLDKEGKIFYLGATSQRAK